ncbi:MULTISPECIES: hypothetical protein [Aphanothece]
MLSILLQADFPSTDAFVFEMVRFIVDLRLNPPGWAMVLRADENEQVQR